MEQAFGHLVQLGHERIGILLGPLDHMPSRRKHDAAVRMAARLGLELGDDRVVHSLYSLESGQTAATKLLAAGVTGIVCASDPMALGAIRAVRRAGLRVPEDVSVIGYDDSALMNCTEPPLTTVRQPIEAMGKMVIELLMRQMSSEQSVGDEVFFAPELVVRGSTAPAPAPAVH
jgi:DNA-binding LacI/PurR family transcriptional regulator